MEVLPFCGHIISRMCKAPSEVWVFEKMIAVLFPVIEPRSPNGPRQLRVSASGSPLVQMEADSIKERAGEESLRSFGALPSLPESGSWVTMGLAALSSWQLATSRRPSPVV